MRVSTAKKSNCLAIGDILKKHSDGIYCTLERIGELKEEKKDKYYYFTDFAGSFTVLGKLVNTFFENNGYEEIVIYEDK